MVSTVGMSAVLLVLLRWLLQGRPKTSVKDKSVLITGASSGLGEGKYSRVHLQNPIPFINRIATPLVLCYKDIFEGAVCILSNQISTNKPLIEGKLPFKITIHKLTMCQKYKIYVDDLSDKLNTCELWVRSL